MVRVAVEIKFWEVTQVQLKKPVSSFALSAFAVTLLAVGGCREGMITPVSSATSIAPASTPDLSTDHTGATTDVSKTTDAVISMPPVPTKETTLSVPTSNTVVNSTTLPTVSGGQTALTTTTRPGGIVIAPAEPTEGPPWTLPPSVEQPVVAEIFTYDGCPYCPEALTALEGAAAGYANSQLVVLEYHTQGKKSTEETYDMWGSYNLSATPIVVFNGQGGSSALFGPYDQARYTTEIDKRLSASSTITIEAHITPGDLLAASVELTNLSTETLANARLYAVVYEDTGVSTNRYLVEDITPVNSFTLSGRTTAIFELNSDIQDSSARHMVVILKSTSGTILQSLFVK